MRLQLADVGVLVEDLPLQVADVDRVEVDDADLADAREREVHRDRRAETARADDQHARLHDLALTGWPDLRHDDVARVAFHLLAGKRADAAPWFVARSAGHRGDHGHLVAVLQRRLDAVQRRDLLLVDVDVDVRGHLAAAAEDEVMEARKLLVDVGEHFADVFAFGLDMLPVAGQLPERRRDVNGDSHNASARVLDGKRVARRRVDHAGCSIDVQMSVVHVVPRQTSSQFQVLVSSY